MSDLSIAPRARLFTTWGTVLYVDAGSGELRHGAIESSPANAVFVADPSSAPARRQGWIMHDTGEGCEPTVCLAEHSWAVSSAAAREASAAPTSLQIVPLERGLLGLRSENLYLCAQPDGRLTLANTWCSTWECFLASEDWCTDVRAISDEPIAEIAGAGINRRMIGKYLIDPRLRIKVSANTKKTKLLIYGYPFWSHGRVYYDICRHLYARGYIVDILNWQVDHASYISEITPFYDLIMAALDGVSTLVDVYGVPHEQIVALSHHEMDLRILIDQKGVEIFDKFAGFGVVGYQLFDASAVFGVQRHPLVVQLGVNFSEFCAEIPERLATVGYASSFSQKTISGVEIKRGELAEAAAREAGLTFKVAGSTGNQISFHDMPDFYRTVDAVLATSVTEGAGLPVKEAAAAGRLVISTPVGDFPLGAYQGGGIIAPIESEKYTKFAAATLKHYKENPAAYVEMCRKIQNAARQFDWEYMIGDWIELIESAKHHLLDQARSHQQAGRFAEAASLFAKQADGRGDEEERWYARWQQARCLKELGAEEGFVRTALAAFRQRPHRAEPLKDLVDHYIATQRAAPAVFYAEAALAIPKPDHDVLFVDDSLYESGLRHIFTVAASWSADAAQKERGRRVCDWLALSRDVPGHIRGPARYNSGWYAESAKSLMPSFECHGLSIAAPDNFRAANLSIMQSGDGFLATVRVVNYTLLPSGYFDIDGDTSFRSRVLLLDLSHDFQITASAEVLPPKDMPPPRHLESLGFEDPRPVTWRGNLWCISCVRELNSEGRAEMVLARIDRTDEQHYTLADWRVLPSGMPVQWEKNWMPQVVGDELRFVYSVDPTRIITEAGIVVHDEPALIAAGGFKGGSQAVPFDGGWLMAVHEHEVVNHKRRYFHRFIWLDAGNVLRRLSRRFYLRRVGYEFVAGMAWHPDGERLVISFSVNDIEPFLAVVSASDVRAVLLDIDEHKRASEQAVEAGRAAWNALTAAQNQTNGSQPIAPGEQGPQPLREPLAAGRGSLEVMMTEPIISELYVGESLLRWEVAHDMSVRLDGDALIVADSPQHSFHLLRLHDDGFLYRIVRLNCLLRRLPTSSVNFYVHHFGALDVAEVALNGSIVNKGISRSLSANLRAEDVLEVEVEFLCCHPTLSIGCSNDRHPVYVGTGREQFAILRIEVETRDATLELSRTSENERITIIDVGGAGGLQLKWMLKAESITPVLFEPSPTEAEILGSTIGRIPGGRVIEKALAHTSSVRRLYHAASPWCTSLRQPNFNVLDRYSIGGAFRTIREEDVDCTRYDELFGKRLVPKPDVIKIDVQGLEYEVLLGFGSLLEECLGIELETHFYPLYRDQKLAGDIVNFLEDFGFVLRALRHVPNFDGDCVEFDAFFTKRRQKVLGLPDAAKKKFSVLTEVWQLSPYF